MINFEEIISDVEKFKSINLVVLLQAFNILMMEYGNPILFTLSAAGSCVYIWLKIRKEFFISKDNK